MTAYEPGELARIIEGFNREVSPYQPDPTKWGEWCGRHCERCDGEGRRLGCCVQCHDEKNPRLRVEK